MKAKYILLSIIICVAAIFRLYSIPSLPPGLYIDEVAIGNNAFSILTTGKDEYGISYPLAFKSYGDYKMPVYIYAVSLAMGILGKNELAIRIPSATAGILTVFIMYLFTKEILLRSKNSFLVDNNVSLGLLSSFFLAISPWHIQFSRGGFEATMALFFFLLGCYLFIKFLPNKKLFLLLVSFFCLALSVYTYHSYRIIAPLTVIALCLFGIKNKLVDHNKIYKGVIFFSLLILPIVFFSFTKNGSERLVATSTFTQLQTHSLQEKIQLSPLIVIKNYITYFSFLHLFSIGDGFGRHQMAGFGPLFRWQLPFLIFGIYVLMRAKNSFGKQLFFYLFFISPIAASISNPSPHILRDFLHIIPFTIAISIGFLYSITKVKKVFLRNSYTIFMVSIIVYELALYLHTYYIHYPQTNTRDWDAGAKKFIEQINKYQSTGKYHYLVIDKNIRINKEYFLFYTSRLQPRYVDVTWKKPLSWKEGSVLYLRPYYGETGKNDKIIKTLYSPGVNPEVLGQFWRL